MVHKFPIIIYNILICTIYFYDTSSLPKQLNILWNMSTFQTVLHILNATYCINHYVYLGRNIYKELTYKRHVPLSLRRNCKKNIQLNKVKMFRMQCHEMMEHLYLFVVQVTNPKSHYQMSRYLFNLPAIIFKALQ